jgi:hypothetical protein
LISQPERHQRIPFFQQHVDIGEANQLFQHQCTDKRQIQTLQVLSTKSKILVMLFSLSKEGFDARSVGKTLKDNNGLGLRRYQRFDSSSQITLHLLFTMVSKQRCTRCMYHLYRSQAQ